MHQFESTDPAKFRLGNGNGIRFRNLRTSASFLRKNEWFRLFFTTGSILVQPLLQSNQRWLSWDLKWQSWALRSKFRLSCVSKSSPGVMLNFGDVTRPKWIPGIHLGRLGWSMGSNVWSAGPEIEKYHEIFCNILLILHQISPFQQKDQKISIGHVTDLAPCHWFK